MKVDVPALLRRIAAVAEVPEEVVLRVGTTMAIRWWRLNADVDPQLRYVGQGRWLPGISLWGCDPDGRFGQTRFFLFNEVTDAVVDVPRVERFLSLFAKARHAARQRDSRATLAHVPSVGAGANKTSPNAVSPHVATRWPTREGAKLAAESRPVNE
jgi:hypothetical protein